MRGALFLLLIGLSVTACDTVFKQKPVVATPVPHHATWYQGFNDPVVTQLVDELTAQNIEMKIAATRLAEARANVQIQDSGLLPQINLNSSAGRGNTNFSKPLTLGKVGFDTSWELDVFGATRANIDAANARVLAQAASSDDVRNIVMADLVRAVITWRQASQAIIETNKLLQAQDAQVSLLQQRAAVGLIDQSFVERAVAMRAQTAATLPQNEAAAKTAQYQIERLLNCRDDHIAVTLSTATAQIIAIPAPQTLDTITINQLRQRPDLRAANANLMAIQANLKAAEADLWPKLTLSNFFGMQDGSDNPFLAGNPVWSLGAALSAPVLNFGRLRGAISVADARTQQAVLLYENTANEAVQETKTALSDYLQGLNAIKAQEESLQHRRTAVDIAQERFNHGLTDMIDLTTAQAELAQATLSLITTRTDAAVAYIRLQKSLAL